MAGDELAYHTYFSDVECMKQGMRIREKSLGASPHLAKDWYGAC
jgi:hypothetical protein